MNRILLGLFVFALGFVLLFFVVEGSGRPLDLDAVVGLLIAFGPWLLGGVLGWHWGRTWLGVAGVVAVGVLLTLGSLAGSLFLTGSSADAACGEDECFHAFGHWIEASLAVQWPIYAVIAWAFSTVVLSSQRHRIERSRSA